MQQQMAKLSKKEEIAFRYLESRWNLLFDMIYGRVECNDDTRQAILDIEDPDLAYHYAYYVDQCPRDDTRDIVCLDPECAYWYCKNVDKKFHPKTREAAHTSAYKWLYDSLCKDFFKDE